MDFKITKNYIPMNKKLDSLLHILTSTLDAATGTYPVGSVEVFELVEIARLYTDIELPEDVVEAYDVLAENNFDLFILDCEAATDIARYKNIVTKQIEKLEKYQTSAYGILDSIKNDYNNLDLDVEKIKNELKDMDNLDTVKEVVEKLG